jgi:predicted house-cleaning noncanonical NTP pyrophosphatase (MazG superfamily)
MVTNEDFLECIDDNNNEYDYFSAGEEEWLDRHQDELQSEWESIQNSPSMERYFDFG